MIVLFLMYSAMLQRFHLLNIPVLSKIGSVMINGFAIPLKDSQIREKWVKIITVFKQYFLE